LNKYQGKNFKSKSGLESFIMKKRLKLISDGHVLANVDSLIWKQDTAKVSIYEGPIFEELSVQIDESDEQIIRRIPGVNERMLSRVDFTAKEVGGVIKKINEYLIENGYPFSSVRLEVDQVKSPITEATLIIDEGPQVSVKEVHIKGSTTISKKFILDVSNYFQEKERITQKAESMPLDALIKTKKQLENARTLFRESMLRRRRKILNLVLIASETGISKQDFENMLGFEKELFEKIMDSIKVSEKKLSEGLKGNGEKENKE
jgi:hypothetical protein